MPIYLKQSTASQEIPLGPFVDSTDGNTEETGLTIANTDIKLWKAGATVLANKNSGGATHISNGVYYAVLDATDTNTLGSLVIFVHVSGALAIKVECVVLAANVYDAMIGGGDALQVHTNEITSDLITAAVIATGAIDADAIAADALTAAKIAADVSAEIADQVWDEAKAGHVAAGSFGEEVQAHSLSTEISALNNLSAAQVNAEVDTALVDYDPPTKAELDAGLAALNDLTAAEVNAEVDAAIETYHLDHLLAVDYDPAAKPGVATALLNELVESDLGVSRFTANALEQAPTGGSAPTAEQIADQVWDEAKAGHVAAGSFGEEVQAHSLSTEISALNDLSAAQVNAEVDTALADYDAPTKAELDAGLAALNDPTAATIADAVWDEAKAGHVAAGSFGEEVQSHATSVELSTLDVDVADAVWDEAVADHIGAGSAGERVERLDVIASGGAGGLTNARAANLDNLDAAVSSRSTLTAAQVNTEADTALTDYDPPTKAELDAGLAALNDLTAAEVNAEVVDVLRTDTLPDSYAADGAQPTISQAVLAILQFLTEKSVAGTTVTVKKPDGATAVMSFTLDDAANPTSITRAT